MNQFTVLVLLLVVFCYCGGKYCPAVLKQNKEILLGVVGGLVLSSFFGLRLETMMTGHEGNVGGTGVNCCRVKEEMEKYPGLGTWNDLRPNGCPTAEEINCSGGK